MINEPKFLEALQAAGISREELPAWLQDAIHCHDEAAKALADAPKARQAELLPILQGSDAVICAQIQRLSPQREPEGNPDKIKLLKLRAKAIQVLARQA